MDWDEARLLGDLEAEEARMKDYIEELEANLAKAVEAATLLADAAHHAVGHLTGYGDTSTARIELREAVEHLRATLAELKGEK